MPTARDLSDSGMVGKQVCTLVKRRILLSTAGRANWGNRDAQQYEGYLFEFLEHWIKCNNCRIVVVIGVVRIFLKLEFL